MTTQSHNKPPKRSPGKIQSRLEEIKSCQFIGPIAPAMPMSKVNGQPRHLAVLDGITIWAMFDQQPPKGSISVDRDDSKWSGNLLFLDPQNQLWTVPNIWYNNTWANRILSFEHSINQINEKAADAKYWLKNLNKPLLTQDEKIKKREDEETVREQPERVKASQLRINHIRKHADLNNCPCLNPLPAEKLDKFE